MRVVGANLTSGGYSLRLRLNNLDVNRLTNEFEVETLRNFRTRNGSIIETVASHVVDVEAELTHTLAKALMLNLCSKSSSGVYYPANSNTGLSTITIVYKDDKSNVSQLSGGYLNNVSFEFGVASIPKVKFSAVFPSNVASGTFTSYSAEDFVHPSKITTQYYSGGTYTDFYASSFSISIDNSVVCDRILDGTFRCFSEALRINGGFDVVYPGTYSTTFEGFYKNGTVFGLRLQYVNGSTFFKFFMPSVVITDFDKYRDYGVSTVRFRAVYTAPYNLIEFTTS
jgi:hypothetical protein